MNLVDLLLAVIKILIVLGFLLTAAGVSTWAERRQSAMVQDRVGPNRAMITLPSMLVRTIVLLPPSILGAAALLPILRDVRNPLAIELLSLNAQLAVLVLWFSLLVLSGKARRSGANNKLEETLAGIDPRTIFFVGVAAHAVTFVVTGSVPAASAVVGAKATGALLGLSLFAAGIYTASRIPDGPMELRLAGLLHTGADVIKMLFKEDFIPPKGDKLLHSLAPMLSMFPALVTFAVIPFGDTICFAADPTKPWNPLAPSEMTWADLGRIAPAMAHDFACRGHAVKLQVADLNVGILYLFAMAGTGVVGAAIAGWASDNKFSLLGGLRAASQMVSYEVAMGMSLLGLFLVYGSVRLQPMVDWQGENAWGIFVQPFAFVLFLAALAAETKRVPFDQPEGESEIVAGYFVEYSGMKWGMFYTGEYVELITSSAILVTLFFGGYHLPFLHRDGISVVFGDSHLYDYKMNHLAVTLISVLTFFGKTIVMTFIQIFFRWTLPRFRYDQVMKLGWTRLLPLAIANMMVTGVLLLAIDAAPAGVKSTLKLLADVSQGLVAVGIAGAFVALVAGLLEPVERKSFIQSTAARFAAAAGGTKASAPQA
ncbi:MAG: complex I subunit 1 family protein [Byssovorax sp.]